MRRISSWVGALLGALVLALVTAATGVASAAATAQIEDIHATEGKVQFVLTADGLAAGAKLDPNSIKVTANGVTLQATASLNASAATANNVRVREVVLVLDASGSMAGEGITMARTAALAYATALPADVRVGLVTFASSARVWLKPSTNRTALKTAINTVSPEGDTALYDGIILAVRAMSKAQTDAEQRLVIMSDGDKDTTSKNALSDAVEALNRGDVAADVVAFRLPGDRTILEQIAASSHGQVISAANAGDLAKAFAVVAQAFSQQVVVTANVPDNLAGSKVALTASIAAGGETIRTTTSATFAESASSADGLAGSTPVPETSSDRWLAIALASAAIVVVAVAVLVVPGMGATEKNKEDRLSEVGRYRIVETMGRTGPTPTVVRTESAFTKATVTFFGRLVSARGKRRTIADQLDRAGIRLKPEEWVAIQMTTILILGVAFAVLVHSLFGVLIGAVVAWFGFRVVLKAKIARRANAFGEQLPDVLQLVAGSLRSGFSLNQSIAGIVNEGTDPTASEFARALTEVRLGSQLEDAIDRVAERMQSLDLHLVVMAIRISREVGGNLAEVLMTTVSTMRERAALKREVKVLSAEGRLSAKILIGLPFLMLIFLLVFKPGYIEPLYTTGPGYVLIAMGVGALSTGSFWVSRLVKIEV